MAGDRFLAKGVTRTKRQRNGRPVNKGGAAAAGPKSRSKKAAKGSEDSGSDSDGIGDIESLEHQYGPNEDELSSEDEDEFLESAADKRLRLAKEYIGKVRTAAEQHSGEIDAAQIDRDLIAERLMTDAKERTGKWSRRIAEQFLYGVDEEHLTELKQGSRSTITCAAVTPDGKFVFSGSKDGSMTKWDAQNGKRIWTVKAQRKQKGGNKSGQAADAEAGKKKAVGHSDHILSIAISSDGQFVATGGRDRKINVWAVRDCRHLTTFHQHKDWVTGLVFRRGANHLYSCSADRMVKMWNIDELAYMDTLFGHQDSIISIAALQREQAVTVGGRDKTVRLWRIADEAQLVFRAGSTTDQQRLTKSLADANKSEATRALDLNQATRDDITRHEDLLRELAGQEIEMHEGSVDCVAMIDEETYVTGGDSGALSLWSVQKKKPIFVQHAAHGMQPNADGSQSVRPRWITALATVPYTDLVLSASSDGYMRLWRMRDGKLPGFDLVNVIEIGGIVNSIDIKEMTGSGGRNEDVLAVKRDLVVVAAVGLEPRLGRWTKGTARNAIKVFHLSAVKPQRK
ncbi:pre-rRNA processing protein [Linderina macrospora]|uniref:Pre-rRNA processing protein n=1 Tax=Linderina macrospora TaxID=4868 RepID=A0ACC1JDU2_9FUNG|nr:pre-rRNA processing protein [Linderina macrospora]